MKFEYLYKDQKSEARVGKISTDNGEIPTPIFMPVGTRGSVKGVDPNILRKDIGASIILGNTYHLYLRPGLEVIEKAEGLHSFMNWKFPILTDSGGYQVYSLGANRKITEKGVFFKSHIDGSSCLFSPENVIDFQRKIGADIIMAFDECTPYPCDFEYAKKSMNLTHEWLDRCHHQFHNTQPLYPHGQSLIPIIQGSVYPNLRIESTQKILEYPADGYAIGGLSVGEPSKDMYAITKLVCDRLPTHKPRYLMGVGTPVNILECIARGVDMFDCVMPTRNARNGMLFTSRGILNIKNKKWKYDTSPIDDQLKIGVSNQYSKAYLRHLIMCKEMLGAQIASIHNLAFYLWLVNEARKRILDDEFTPWKNEMVKQLTNKC